MFQISIHSVQDNEHNFLVIIKPRVGSDVTAIYPKDPVNRQLSSQVNENIVQKYFYVWNH